jgi:hypothetical protein
VFLERAAMGPHHLATPLGHPRRRQLIRLTPSVAEAPAISPRLAGVFHSGSSHNQPRGCYAGEDRADGRQPGQYQWHR